MAEPAVTGMIDTNAEGESLALAAPVAGPRLAVRQDYLQRFVSALREAAVAGIAGPDWIAGHNALALYTYGLLHFCSGHRAVADPHHDLDLMDLEHGLAVIMDKASDRGKAARLTFLAEMAAEQVRRYVRHLKALAVRIDNRDPVRAAEVFAVSEPGLPRPLPLLFCLDNDFEPIPFGPSTLVAHLGERWRLPLHANRGALGSFLLAHGCPAELVEAQLGHAESGCQPFGPVSVLSPLEVASRLRPHLTAYLASLGWQVVGGLTQYHLGKLELLRKRAQALTSRTDFGPQWRETQRAESWRRQAEEIDAVIEQALRPYGEVTVPEEAIRELLDRLIDFNRDSPRTFLLRYTLVRRKLLSLRAKGVKVPIPGRLAVAETEPPGFDAASLANAKRAAGLREQFLELLAVRQRSGEPLSVARRVAEISVSAVLFGGLLFDRALEHLPAGLLDGTAKLNDVVWVDIVLDPALKSSPIRRWIPDPLSTALIEGLWRMSPGPERPHVAESELAAELVLLLTVLAPPAKRRVNRVKTQSCIELLRPLIKVASCDWRLRLPAHLAAYAMGEHLAPSLPLD